MKGQQINILYSLEEFNRWRNARERLVIIESITSYDGALIILYRYL